MVAAFLVFAISMGILMQILATSMRNTRQSSDYTMAALWAQSKLDTVGVGSPIEAGRSSGRFDDVYGWELDIQQVDPASVEPPPQTATPMAGNQQQASTPVGPFEVKETSPGWFGIFGADGQQVGKNMRAADADAFKAMSPEEQTAYLAD